VSFDLSLEVDSCGRRHYLQSERTAPKEYVEICKDCMVLGIYL
jgi:hypothetical protein